jgi:hypothetical protein
MAEINTFFPLLVLVAEAIGGRFVSTCGPFSSGRPVVVWELKILSVF